MLANSHYRRKRFGVRPARTGCDLSCKKQKQSRKEALPPTKAVIMVEPPAARTIIRAFH